MATEKNAPEQKKIPGTSKFGPAFYTANDELSATLAAGVLTFYCVIILLFLVGYFVAAFFQPDIEAIRNAAAPLSVFPVTMFHPEPVERTQYQLILFCLPLFVFFVFHGVARGRSWLVAHPVVSRTINFSGIGIFLMYLPVMLAEPLKETKIPGKVNAYFFEDLPIGKFFLPAFIIYSALAYLLLRYKNWRQPRRYQQLFAVACGCIALFFIVELIRYNTFHLSDLNFGTQMETNALFYSVTQVFAGKSLLVDFNAQYGLYAWILKPVFKITGLSIASFTTVMSLLNGLSFLLLYLGIRKVIRNDLFALITFMCLLFWQYWHLRVGIEEASHPDFYFQYWPIRLIFPCAVFFLFSSLCSAKGKMQFYLLPLLAITAATGVLWNLDTGLVAWGAATAALVVLAIDKTTELKTAVSTAFYYLAFMIGGLCVMVGCFFISTKMHSGHWPEIARFSAYQSQFYISGYFMLPMTALHFWNLVGFVYVAAAICCVASLRKNAGGGTPVIALLTVMGMGLFVYFQGRSYDLTIMIVMYPAIILAGILTNQISLKTERWRIAFHEIALFFLVPFLFIADGAFSMIYFAPEIHSLAGKNVTIHEPQKEEEMAGKLAFIKKNLRENDSVIIIAKDFESYYYAGGAYFNPLNIPGSTEIFLKSDFSQISAMIEKMKYPVIYDVGHPWAIGDSLVSCLARVTKIEDETPDHSLWLLKPHISESGKLSKEERTMYYDNLGGFRKLMHDQYAFDLQDTFVVELLIVPERSGFRPGEVVFSNAIRANPFYGMYMKQGGADLNSLVFAYGNGYHWCDSATVRLSPGTENDVRITVLKNNIFIYNNGVLSGQTDTHSAMKNSEGAFVVNPRFSGDVRELKIVDH